MNERIAGCPSLHTRMHAQPRKGLGSIRESTQRHTSTAEGFAAVGIAASEPASDLEGRPSRRMRRSVMKEASLRRWHYGRHRGTQQNPTSTRSDAFSCEQRPHHTSDPNTLPLIFSLPTTHAPHTLHSYPPVHALQRAVQGRRQREGAHADRLQGGQDGGRVVAPPAARVLGRNARSVRQW